MDPLARVVVTSLVFRLRIFNLVVLSDKFFLQVHVYQKDICIIYRHILVVIGIVPSKWTSLWIELPPTNSLLLTIEVTPMSIR
jgi:hypothetical protein